MVYTLGHWYTSTTTVPPSNSTSTKGYAMKHSRNTRWWHLGEQGRSLQKKGTVTMVNLGRVGLVQGSPDTSLWARFNACANSSHHHENKGYHSVGEPPFHTADHPKTELWSVSSWFFHPQHAVGLDFWADVNTILRQSVARETASLVEQNALESLSQCAVVTSWRPLV